MTDGYMSSSIEPLLDSFARQGEFLMTSIAPVPEVTKEAAVDCLYRSVPSKISGKRSTTNSKSSRRCSVAH